MKSILAVMAILFCSSIGLAEPIPRPEHPRPDMEREEWISLNGPWEFGETNDDNDVTWLAKKSFPDKINVPFCRESKLSGLGRTGFVRNVWYRRTFRIPQNWKSKMYALHVGASDWKTTLWLNGTEVNHVGGQSPFTLFLRSSDVHPGENTVVIRAFDDTRSGLQALGKQCTQEASFGCLYTRTTGIWQSVWLEGVGDTSIYQTKITSDIEKGTFAIQANLFGDLPADEVVATAFDGKVVVGRSTNKVNRNSTFLTLKISKPKLWAPGHPNLYTIVLETKREGKVVDRLSTYAGLREVKIKGRAILINKKPVFQRLVLDQGFYPDGIWTAPTDEALKRDIELSMAAGFNGARLHQKVFEPRFLYWADKLGYLVWGEYPNWGLNYENRAVNGPVLREWSGVVQRDFNHPSIVGWCPFNETPASAGALQNSVVAQTRAYDTTRPIIDTSGYVHSLTRPFVLDAHDYDQIPKTFKARYLSMFGASDLPQRYLNSPTNLGPFMVSEYGGIGWDTTGGWGYGEGPKTIDEFYSRFKGLTDALLDNPDMFGFCYTQLTDVEQERNGIYKYDRTPKFDSGRLSKIIKRRAAIEKSGIKALPQKPHEWSVLVGSKRDNDKSTWFYMTEKPPSTWMTPGSGEKDWLAGQGGFGDKGGAEGDIGTRWTSPDIYLRKRFEYNGGPFREAAFAIHYDNACQIYLNGQLVWRSEPNAWNDVYEKIEVTRAIRKAIKRGSNLIAVHCHQDTGGQFIDLALLVRN